MLNKKKLALLGLVGTLLLLAVNYAEIITCQINPVDFTEPLIIKGNLCLAFVFYIFSISFEYTHHGSYGIISFTYSLTYLSIVLCCSYFKVIVLDFPSRLLFYALTIFIVSDWFTDKFSLWVIKIFKLKFIIHDIQGFLKNILGNDYEKMKKIISKEDLTYALHNFVCTYDIDKFPYYIAGDYSEKVTKIYSSLLQAFGIKSKRIKGTINYNGNQYPHYWCAIDGIGLVDIAIDAALSEDNICDFYYGFSSSSSKIHSSNFICSSSNKEFISCQNEFELKRRVYFLCGKEIRLSYSGDPEAALNIITGALNTNCKVTSCSSLGRYILERM